MNLLTLAIRHLVPPAKACEETAAAKRRDSPRSRVDAASGRSVRLLAHTSVIYDRALRSGEASAPATASDAAGKQARVAGTSAYRVGA